MWCIRGRTTRTPRDEGPTAPRPPRSAPPCPGLALLPHAVLCPLLHLGHPPPDRARGTAFPPCRDPDGCLLMQVDSDTLTPLAISNSACPPELLYGASNVELSSACPTRTPSAAGKSSSARWTTAAIPLRRSLGPHQNTIIGTVGQVQAPQPELNQHDGRNPAPVPRAATPQGPPLPLPSSPPTAITSQTP